MSDIVITHAARTPIGRFCGSLKDVSAVSFTTQLAKNLLEPLGILGDLDKVILGMARQAGAGPNPARQVAVFAGIPESATALTINMACGSGLYSILHAAEDIRAGRQQIVLAGGLESMTQVPFLLDRYREGYRLGHGKLVDNMYADGFQCRLVDQLMGRTAETLAEDYSISRDEQDDYAFESQRRCAAAARRGDWNDEIIPLTLTSRKGDVVFDTDEHPRHDVKRESMGRLPTVFKDEGTVSPGNSSGITDGASLLLVMSREEAEKRGFEILATVGPWAEAGVDPARMGLGPVPSTRKLLEMTGRSVDDYDLVELNEAFAAQVLACNRELKIDPERLNVNGGSIALGHPIGCTGARIVTTLLHEMKRRGASRGLATLCISGGLGLAAEFTREGKS